MKQIDLFEEDDSDDSITIDLSDLKMDSDSSDTVEIHPWIAGASMIDTITLGTGSGIYTTGPSWQFDNSTVVDGLNHSAKIKLDGQDADIEINGRSVMGILDSIEQRLGLLRCREDLEQEWEELKALGDQYRSKLAEIENKQEMWDALKKMPPPRID